MEKKAKIDFDKTFKNYSSKEGISFREEYLNKFLENSKTLYKSMAYTPKITLDNPCADLSYWLCNQN